MATLPVAQTDEGDKRAAGQKLAAIVRCVMETLGRPDDFLRATVRSVSGNNYRINVVVGVDAASARIPHSFFVTADDDGTILSSVPAITKCY
jgi:hypothetical protein